MANTDWRKHVLTNGKEIKLCMSKDEIYASYRDAKHKDQQITVLADLNSVTAGSMALYLAELGFDNGYIRNRAKNTAKKLKDTSAPNVTKKMPNVTKKAPEDAPAEKPKVEKKKDKTAEDINVPPSIKKVVCEKPTTRTRLLNDTLVLISRFEDEYRYCCMLIESIEERKSKLRENIDALAVVYHNVEEMSRSDK